MHPFLRRLEQTMRRLDREASIRWREIYMEARHEHAWLLRAEGVTLREIGQRLGVCREVARNNILKRGRIASRQMRKVRFTISYGEVA